jgi:hypothetical protein
MRKKKEYNPTYYDTHSFYEDMVEAKKNGTLIVIQEGESLESGLKRLREAQARHKARLAAEAKNPLKAGTAPKGGYFADRERVSLPEESVLCVAEPSSAYVVGG